MSEPDGRLGKKETGARPAKAAPVTGGIAKKEIAPMAEDITRRGDDDPHRAFLLWRVEATTPLNGRARRPAPMADDLLVQYFEAKRLVREIDREPTQLAVPRRRAFDRAKSSNPMKMAGLRAVDALGKIAAGMRRRRIERLLGERCEGCDKKLDAPKRFCDKRCGNRARKRAFDAKKARNKPITTRADDEPKCDAMDKRALPPDENSWDFADYHDLAVDDFDSDRLIEMVAHVCDDRGERTRAKELRAVVSKAVTK